MGRDGARGRPRQHQHPILLEQRIGVAVLGVVLWALGALMVPGGGGYLTEHHTGVLGITGNGLLATVSFVVGAILLAAAARGAVVASDTAIVFGVLFLLAGLLGLAVLSTQLNILRFTQPNVIFSLVVGMALLFVGLHGRASGQLPPDNPYLRRRGGRNPVARLWHGESLAQETISDPVAARRRLDEIRELADAEHAMAEGVASPEQERAVMADARVRARQLRASAWRRR